MFRLLCITAHPDDEAGGFGGTLRLYRERGVETHVICLTPGQAATHRGTSTSPHELAEMRRREFAASCEILKVSHAEVLDFPDGALDRAPLYDMVEAVVLRMRSIRPHVVITFGSEGAVTAHPDHSMTSAVATLAFQWAPRTNRYVEQLQNGARAHRAQKLYYATAGFTLPERQPVSLAPTTAIIEVGQYLEDKIRAFKAHLTQAPLFPLFEKNVSRRGTKEMFHLVAASVPRVISPETDLFSGVDED
jgi:LmbE family N-acetylglucosaminyl deacetylase